MPRSGSGRPTLVRIQERLAVEDRGHVTPCHIWLGPTADGYGHIRVGSRTDGSRRTIKVHRFMYEMFVGPIPEPLVIDHLCRQRACANPDHLELVTRQENVLRGTSPDALRARFAAMTHCARGHEYTAENTYLWVSPRGHTKRRCQTCRRERRKAAVD